MGFLDLFYRGLIVRLDYSKGCLRRLGCCLAHPPQLWLDTVIITSHDLWMLLDLQALMASVFILTNWSTSLDRVLALLRAVIDGSYIATPRDNDELFLDVR